MGFNPCTCGIRNSACRQVCRSINLICHPITTPANETSLVVWSSWVLPSAWIQFKDLLNFSNVKFFLSEVSQLRAGINSCIWLACQPFGRGLELARCVKTAVCSFFKVCFMGSWVSNYFDGYNARFSQTSFCFQIPLLIGRVGNRWLIQKSCAGFNPCVVHFCVTFRWDYTLKASRITFSCWYWKNVKLLHALGLSTVVSV